MEAYRGGSDFNAVASVELFFAHRGRQGLLRSARDGDFKRFDRIFDRESQAAHAVAVLRRIVVNKGAFTALAQEKADFALNHEMTFEFGSLTNLRRRKTEALKKGFERAQIARGEFDVVESIDENVHRDELGRLIGALQEELHPSPSPMDALPLTKQMSPSPLSGTSLDFEHTP